MSKTTQIVIVYHEAGITYANRYDEGNFHSAWRVDASEAQSLLADGAAVLSADALSRWDSWRPLAA
jgi:hypothetical protein